MNVLACVVVTLFYAVYTEISIMTCRPSNAANNFFPSSSRTSWLQCDDNPSGPVTHVDPYWIFDIVMKGILLALVHPNCIINLELTQLELCLTRTSLDFQETQYLILKLENY